MNVWFDFQFLLLLVLSLFQEIYFVFFNVTRGSSDDPSKKPTPLGLKWYFKAVEMLRLAE